MLPRRASGGIRQQKTGEHLLVTMTPEIRATVDAARRLHGNVLGAYLFRPRGSGKPYSYSAAQGAFQKARDEAGVVDSRLHDLRAVSLTEAERQGLDATALAGHQSPQMTARYLRGRVAKVVQGRANLRHV